MKRLNYLKEIIKENKIKCIIGICGCVVVFSLVLNYWEYIEQLTWGDDPSEDIYNTGTAMPTPWGFKMEDKDIYKGLDLSHHNKIIEYDNLSEFDFIYHKATEGSSFVDPKFETRFYQFVKMGIPVGAYHFFTTSSSGKAQFENFKRVVPKTAPLIPVLDIEINKNKWSASKLNRELSVWINLCEEYYGIKPIIYSSSWFYARYSLFKHKCLFWSGDINSTPKIKCCIHQKRFEKVKGIIGEVDYNEAKAVYFNPYSEYKEF
jgi:lysozyme